MRFTTRPELRGTFGMVASTHWLASATGMSVLERGGNAFDAAVAAGFTLQVVEPHLNGPGGEVPILFYEAAQGSVRVVCGQGSAPEAATIDAVRGLGITDPIPGTGLVPACVPGAFGGWMTLLLHYGTMTPRQVLSYAIDFALGGYPLVDRIPATIAAVEELFTSHWPTSAEVYLPVPAAGELFRNEALGRTYERIVMEAEAAGSDRQTQIEAAVGAFYEGFVAVAIDKFVRQPVMDVTGEPHTGLLTGEDLATWRATIEEPLSLSYESYEIYKPSSWSQGPVLLQQLALLDGFGLDGFDPEDDGFVHTIVECAKLAFADRDCFYGDPAFVDVPLDDLLSPGYADARRTLVGDQSSDELRPGSPGGRQPRFPPLDIAAGSGAGVGEPTIDRSAPPGGDTCHLDVADRWGNVVSATPSGGWLQSSPVVPELGFCLGTRGQMFWLDDTHPAALSPGKRPRTTLSPSLARTPDGGHLGFGTPGGDQQDQWPLIVFLNLVHRSMNLQEAIDAPHFHTDSLVSSFYPRGYVPRDLHIEERVGEAAISGLRRREHDVTVDGPWSLGRVTAVASEQGILKAAANPRGMQGYAIGR